MAKHKETHHLMESRSSSMCVIRVPELILYAVVDVITDRLYVDVSFCRGLLFGQGPQGNAGRAQG